FKEFNLYKQPFINIFILNLKPTKNKIEQIFYEARYGSHANLINKIEKINNITLFLHIFNVSIENNLLESIIFKVKNVFFTLYKKNDPRYHYMLHKILKYMGGGKDDITKNFITQVLNLEYSLKRSRKYQRIIYRFCDIKKYKKNTAVCLWGLLRGNYKNSLKTIQKNIIQPLNADLFVHIWDTYQVYPGFMGDINFARRMFKEEIAALFPNELSNKFLMKQYFPRTYDKISIPISTDIPKKELYSLISPNMLDIENEEVIKNSLNFPIEKLKYNHPIAYPYSLIKIYYSMYKNIVNLLHYENKNNIKYDNIIFARIDIGFNFKSSYSFFEYLNKNDIFIPTPTHGADNRIFGGKKDAIIQFISLYNEIIRQQKLDIFDINFLGEATDLFWILKNNLKIKNWKININTTLNLEYVPNFLKELELDLNENDLKNREDFKILYNFLKNNERNIFDQKY
ncbi:hypothetical protein, partial [Campylobacter volucris]|uniref:hypothetical protein n=2 Tax=Campylobacter volucris TaxID=1031542 RepID=UPI001E37F70C